MKTKAPKAAAASATTTLVTGVTEVDTPPAQPTSAFYALLDRQVQPNGAAAAQTTKAEGIAIGTLVNVSAYGSQIQVEIPSLGLGPLPAVSMVALGQQHIGQSLALGFEGANAHRPVVLGLMMQAATGQPTTERADDAAQRAVHVTQNGRRVVVEAHSELELRCGEAVILLSEDGQIQIRGAYVTTHASASNRIRGGSVQIN